MNRSKVRNVILLLVGLCWFIPNYATRLVSLQTDNSHTQDGDEPTEARRLERSTNFHIGGWTSFDGHLYGVSDSAQSYTIARNSCLMNFGYVVEISSAEENEFVRSLRGTRDRLWIGLTSDRTILNHKQSFLWDKSRRRPQYTNWNTGEPNDKGNKEYCVDMFESGRWNDEYCQLPKFFVCERDDPKHEWKKINPASSWYKYHDPVGGASRSHALSVCKAHGAFLPEVMSEDENNFLTVPGKYSWLGASRLLAVKDLKTGWMWDHSSSMPCSYLNWKHGEPNNFYNHHENCLQLYDSGEWNDNTCSKQVAFWCQKEKQYFVFTRTRRYWYRQPMPAFLIGQDKKQANDLTASDCKKECNEKAECKMVVFIISGTADAYCKFYNMTATKMVDANMKLEFYNKDIDKGVIEYQVFERHEGLLMEFNWLHYRGHKYFYVSENLKWSDASYTCQNMGGYLVIISSAQENDFVNKMRPAFRASAGDDLQGDSLITWIGLFKSQWYEGKAELTFTHWGDNGPPEHNCGGMQYSSGNYWTNIPCDNSGSTKWVRDFICEKESAAEDWIKHNDHEYVFFMGEVPWSIARETCVDVGGYLAVIDSEEENTFLKTNMPQGLKTWTWIGLKKNMKDTDPTAGWGWDKKTDPSLKYHAWASGQPSNTPYEFCGVLFPLGQGDPGRWNNVPCNWLYNVWCERSSFCKIGQYRPQPADECISPPNP